MLLIIAVAAVSIVSLAIVFFLTDRSHWRKILLIVGILGAALSGLQAYNNRQRADGLQNEVGTLQQKQEYWDVSKLNALGLTGIAGPGLVEHTAINNLIGRHVKLEPKFWVDCLPEATTAFEAVIAMNENFPFTYYYKALCSHANQREGWQRNLERARRILRITTTIPGHNQNHDEVLKIIESDGANPPGSAKSLEPPH
jgi:hypothetical protein